MLKSTFLLCICHRVENCSIIVNHSWILKKNLVNEAKVHSKKIRRHIMIHFDFDDLSFRKYNFSNDWVGETFLSNKRDISKKTWKQKEKRDASLSWAKFRIWPYSSLIIYTKKVIFQLLIILTVKFEGLIFWSLDDMAGKSLLKPEGAL